MSTGSRWGRCIGCCPAVLSVVHPLVEPWAAETAALLYAGDDAVLSHESAAAVWGLAVIPSFVVITRDWPQGREPAAAAPPPGQGPGHPRRPHASGLSGDLPGADPDRLRRRRPGDRSAAQRGAGAEAGHGRGDPRGDGRAARAARASRPLRALLETEQDSGFTRSEAERHPEAAHRGVGDRAADLQHLMSTGVEADAYWPRLKLVIEVDGYQAHGHWAAFQRDRAKANRLVAAGFVVLRFTWHQLTQRPMQVVAEIARTLARLDARGGLNTDMQPLQSGRAGMLSGHAVLGCRVLVPGGDGGRRSGDAAGGAAGPTAGRGGPSPGTGPVAAPDAAAGRAGDPRRGAGGRVHLAAAQDLPAPREGRASRDRAARSICGR